MSDSPTVITREILRQTVVTAPTVIQSNDFNQSLDMADDVTFRNITSSGGIITGDGSGLTNLPISTEADTIATVLGRGNTATSDMVLTGDITATNFIGDGSQLTGLPEGGSGASAPLTLTGTTDAVQLKVIGNATQTANVIEIDNSTKNLFKIDGIGNSFITSTASSGFHNLNTLTLNSTHPFSTSAYIRGIVNNLDVTGVGISPPFLKACNAQVNAVYNNVTISGDADFQYPITITGNGVTTWNTASGDLIIYTTPTITKNSGSIDNLYGLKVEDLTAGTNNYAIKTGLGEVEFGDTNGIIMKSPDSSRWRVTIDNSGVLSTTKL